MQTAIILTHTFISSELYLSLLLLEPLSAMAPSQPFMASREPSPLFSLVPQNRIAEACIEKLGDQPYVSEFPNPQGTNGKGRVVCVKFNPASASGLEPNLLGNHQFMLNMKTGEVLLEDFSDDEVFRFTGPTALDFPNPPHPRRLIVDCNTNLEFECIDDSGSWSRWRILWHQEPPMDVLLWERESTDPRTGVVSPILTNDDGCEVCPGYNKTPESSDDLIRYVDRSQYFGSKFGAPQAVVDVGTGQHLAVKTVSYPFKIEARRSLLDRVIRSCNLSHVRYSYIVSQKQLANIDSHTSLPSSKSKKPLTASTSSCL